MDIVKFNLEFTELTKVYNKELSELFDNYFVDSSMPICFNKRNVYSSALYKIYDDLIAFVEEDPAARGEGKIATESTGFKAVRYYRYVQSIIEEVGNIDNYPYIMIQTRKVAEEAKVKTGVDIHPLAKIGKCFIIDHGVNTVIGERCVIGENFHVMQDVVLGANSSKKCDPKDRHPKIGNNVTVYGAAKILGNIRIGDNCIIGANCIVLEDVPDNSNISLVNQLQITKIKSSNSPKIFGIIPSGENVLKIAGENMDGLDIQIVQYVKKNSTLIMKIHDLVSCEIVKQNSDEIILKINICSDVRPDFSIRLFSKLKNVDIIIKHCLAYNYIK